ncbi:MAG: hypothetical protein FJ137_10705 [Deltaproteobacteria bacterium]|nr:hypothetical protein [Deltaproteobacteria bacterium]
MSRRWTALTALTLRTVMTTVALLGAPGAAAAEHPPRARAAAATATPAKARPAATTTATTTTAPSTSADASERATTTTSTTTTAPSASADASERATTTTTTTSATTATTATTTRAVLRVAVYDLSVAGDVAPRVGRFVTDALVAELRKRQGLSVVGLDEVRALVAHEAERQRAGCSDDGCLAEIVDALGADVLLTGGLSSLGDERVFALRRLTTTDATATASETLRLRPAGGDEFLAAVGPVVERLFADHPLRAGEQQGVDPRLALRMNPPPLPAGATLAVASLAVTAGATAAVTGWATAVAQERYEDAGAAAVAAGKDGFPGRELATIRDDGVVWATTTNALLGGTLALGVGAGVMAGFTDWAALDSDD